MPPKLAPKAKAAGLAAKAKARAAAAQAANRAARAAAKAAAIAAKAGAAAGVAGAGAAAGAAGAGAAGYVPPPWVAGLLAGLGGGAAGPPMLPGKAGAPVPPAAFAGAGPPAPPHGMMRPPMPGPGMMLPGWGGGFGHLMAQQLGGGMTPPYGHFMGMQPFLRLPRQAGRRRRGFNSPLTRARSARWPRLAPFLRSPTSILRRSRLMAARVLCRSRLCTRQKPRERTASSSFLGAPGQRVLRLSRWHVRAGQSFISVLVCARSRLEVAWSCT
jgi:hypothetical protein